MGNFIAGVLVASLCWGGGLFLWAPELFDAGEEEEIALALDEPEAEAAPEEEAAPRRRRRRGGRSQESGAPSRMSPTGNAQIGDELLPGERTIDGAGSGGEEQLRSAQIDAGFDSAMPQIRRCFLLIPEDVPVRGRLTFGLQIAPSGSVSRVNLSGPAGITQSDAGECMTRAARGIQFPRFDGPEMTVRMPITLE